MSDRWKCDACGEEGGEGDLGNGYGRTLAEIHHLAERLDPGGVVPVGACPCGALCYLITPPPRNPALDALGTLLRMMETPRTRKATKAWEAAMKVYTDLTRRTP